MTGSTYLNCKLLRPWILETYMSDHNLSEKWVSKEDGRVVCCFRWRGSLKIISRSIIAIYQLIIFNMESKSTNKNYTFHSPRVTLPVWVQMQALIMYLLIYRLSKFGTTVFLAPLYPRCIKLAFASYQKCSFLSESWDFQMKWWAVQPFSSWIAASENWGNAISTNTC